PEDIAVDKVNIAEKFGLIREYWKPYIAAELNGQHVKIDKLKGEFVWHHHDNEDEMFLVVKGRFRMDLRDKPIWIEEGEFIVIPRGVEHRPVADEEAWIVLFEPATTLNTGNVDHAMTLRTLDRICTPAALAHLAHEQRHHAAREPLTLGAGQTPVHG